MPVSRRHCSTQGSSVTGDAAVLDVVFDVGVPVAGIDDEAESEDDGWAASSSADRRSEAACDPAEPRR
jgi:hypothetical protein